MPDLADFVVNFDATLIDAVDCIERNRSRAAVVVDGDKVVGVVSEGDVMRALLHGTDVHAPLRDVASVSFKYLNQRDAGVALQLMQRHGISLVPVVSSDFSLVDVMTLRDVLSLVRVMDGDTLR